MQAGKVTWPYISICVLVIRFQMKGMNIYDIVVGPCHQSGSKIAVTTPLQLGTPSGAPGGASRARADATIIFSGLTASQSVGVSFGGMTML